jgi:preprotein translocase subunit SecG
MLFTVLLSLVILVAVLLVLVILAQNSKGGGLTSQFGGSGASNMIGVKKTGDLLENLTWGLVITMFLLILSSSFLLESGAQQTDEFQDWANESTIIPPSLDLQDGEALPEGTEGTDIEEPANDDADLDQLAPDTVN